ncbi:MAG: LlaJI family restriction endonuclease, partial [Clostridia bacterium]|nr:LlaJI family restriction endonuclease [Clostridia bacterium]
GYYFEHETVVKANVSGKINWKKTIKNNSIWFDDGNIVYNKIFSNVKQIDDDAIISEIYKFCLSVAVKNLGFVFGIEKTDESGYGLKDLDFMVYYLKKRNNSTFLDYKKLLFGHMLNILLEGKIQKEETSIFANDREFEYVFELLIDKVFGIRNKKRFNPTARYVFDDKKTVGVKTLRPDTIFEYDKDGQKFCWVVDAKYYSFNYGDMSSTGLPAQSSINKQFIYQKFIETNVYKNGEVKVGSVFILPFCAKDNEPKIQYMNGYAEARWNNEVEGKVYLFKVDLKTLFDDFYNNNDKLRLEFIKELKALQK